MEKKDVEIKVEIKVEKKVEKKVDNSLKKESLSVTVINSENQNNDYSR